MARRISGGSRAYEFLESGIAHGEEGGSEELAAVGEAVAVAFGDFPDDAVGTQEAELAADLGGKGRDVVIGSLAWIEQRAQIAISEAGGGKLAACNDFEQGQIGGIANAQRPNTASVVAYAGRDLIEEFAEPGGVVDGTEGVEVGLVGALGDLGAAVKVSDPLSARVARRACQRESARRDARP